MYWKYHLEAGDLVKFRAPDEYDRDVAFGTVRSLIMPPDFDPDAVESADDVPLSDFRVRIESGTENVTVSMDDVLSRTPEDERESDIPHLSERLRLSGGVDQTPRTEL